jgi:hypothetical protein
MRTPTRSIGAFAVCFAVGASLSLLFGLESRIWVPAGLVVSTIVARFGFQK